MGKEYEDALHKRVKSNSQQTLKEKDTEIH